MARTPKPSRRTATGRSQTRMRDRAEDGADPAFPGPSPDAATNLVLADILIRAGGTIVRRAVERNLLKGRFGKDTAQDIIANRKARQTLAAAAAAQLATRSVPGAAVVGAGIGLKLLLDLSNRRRARLRGQRKLVDQAKDEN